VTIAALRGRPAVMSPLTTAFVLFPVTKTRLAGYDESLAVTKKGWAVRQKRLGFWSVVGYTTSV
jgi:hypothetical protein